MNHASKSATQDAYKADFEFTCTSHATPISYERVTLLSFERLTHMNESFL